MDGELLPCWEGLAAEATGLVLWPSDSFMMALLNLPPSLVVCTKLFYGRLGFQLGLRKPVFSNKMLKEVVSAVARVVTVLNIAFPPF